MKKLTLTAELWLSAVLLLCGLACGWGAVWYHHGEFSPDSYSYYDIAQTFGAEFGRVNTIRQYVIKSDYNCSFPYVWPFLLFLTDKLTGLGMETGAMLNCVLMLLTGVLLLFLSRHFCHHPLCGAVTAVCLFCNPHYLEEVYAGRAIPLAMLLTYSAAALSCQFFLAPKRWMPFLIGLLTGLDAMTRFDEISLMVYLIPVLFWAAGRGKRIQTLLLYGLGAGVIFLPWCLYCMEHFATPYFSDNNGTIWRIYAEVPSYVWLPETPVPTLWNAPRAWWAQLLHDIRYTFVFAQDIPALLLQMGMIFVLTGVCQKARQAEHFAKFRESLQNMIKINSKVWCLLLITGLYLLAKLLMYALVGYVVRRYYVEPIFLFGFAVLMVLYRQLLADTTRTGALVTVAVMLMNLISFSTNAFSPVGRKDPNLDWISELDTALTKAGAPPSDAVFVIGSLEGFSLGALTHWKTYVTPVNVTPETVSYVLQDYADPAWIVLSRTAGSDIREMLAAAYPEAVYSDFFLYQTKKSPIC